MSAVGQQPTAPAAAGEAQDVLELRGLHVWFDAPDGRSAHAVRGVDLSVSPGERVGVLGESGCGKTTMILAAMGLLPSFASVGGRVLLDGVDVLARGEQSARGVRWTRAAMVFQGAMSAMNPVYRVGKQITDPMVVHGQRSKAQARQRTAELLELVGLPASVARRYPHELSGGMRQRAVIAMALACEPKVLFADEPTTALDVVVQKGILLLLMELQERMKSTILFVSHDMGVHYQISHKMFIMYAAKGVEFGDSDKVFGKPIHPYTRMLIESLPAIGDDNLRKGVAGRPPSLWDKLVGCRFAERCPFVTDICRAEEPPLKQYTPGHFAACHLGERFV